MNMGPNVYFVVLHLFYYKVLGCIVELVSEDKHDLTAIHVSTRKNMN